MPAALEGKLKVDRATLAQIVRELKTWKAPATTLLSLYVPPGRPVSDVISLLRQELSITDNIKLKRTKDAVQAALTMALERLSMIQKIPENGLALFCGRDSDNRDEICVAFSPPEAVRVFFYRTDKWFHTEFLEDMLEEKELYGLIIVERDEATIGLLAGNRITVLDELADYIPGKHSKGGQSQRRYDRIIEQMVEDFYKKVAERAKELLEPYLAQGRLRGLLIGGPGYSKKDFVSGEYLDHRLRALVLPTLIDVAYQGEVGLREMVLKAENVIQGNKYARIVNKIEELKVHMARDDGLAVFGESEVSSAIESGVLETLIVVEDHPKLEELKSKASSSGAEVVIVPSSIPESEWLSRAFGGVAGVLRLKARGGS
ncbi:MAG: peptide chain release factor aRF-1 [Fervidicoccaceae archaeon]